MMNAILQLDQQTMFMVDALLLLVFAVAFAFAGVERQDRKYWLYMMLSNIILSVAFLIFSREIGGKVTRLFVPNLLLFVGLSFRWIAIREFFGHSVSVKVISVPPLAAITVFVFSPWLGNNIIFGTLNLLITLQIAAIIWSITSEREILKSKWGIVASYAVLVISSFLRVLQGWLFDASMQSMLPADVFLQLNLIAAAIHISANGAFSLLIAYERNVNRLREMAFHDPLTGLLNRWSIETVIRSSSGKKNCKLITAIMIDIDLFKMINDSYGHSAGDAALRHCAKLIKETFLNDCTIARVGGEEFMILVHDQKSRRSYELCLILREKLRDNPFSHEGLSVPFTISIGICTGYINTRTDLDHIWKRADKALYVAKSSGRDKIEIAESNV